MAGVLGALAVTDFSADTFGTNDRVYQGGGTLPMQSYNPKT